MLNSKKQDLEKRTAIIIRKEERCRWAPHQNTSKYFFLVELPDGPLQRIETSPNEFYKRKERERIYL